MDPDPDPAVFAPDLQDAKKKTILVLSFLLIRIRMHYTAALPTLWCMNFLLLGVDTLLRTMLNSYNELIVQDVQYVSVVGGGGMVL
jgi:hypothetical protein